MYLTKVGGITVILGMHDVLVNDQLWDDITDFYCIFHIVHAHFHILSICITGVITKHSEVNFLKYNFNF